MTGAALLDHRSHMTQARIALPIAASLVLAACGSSPSVPTPTTHDETSGFWRGTSTRFQVESRSCPHPGLVTIQVWDDKFQYRWDNKTWVDAAILADGTVQGQAPGISMIGKMAGKRMEGDVTNGDCGLHFTVVKSDN